jgi:hypothetical protein
MISFKAFTEERDYAKEYANYHSRPDQVERRTARNAANDPLNNDPKNLAIVTQHYNRREPRLRDK